MIEQVFMLAGYVLFASLSLGIILNRRGRHRTIYQPCSPP